MSGLSAGLSSLSINVDKEDLDSSAGSRSRSAGNIASRLSSSPGGGMEHPVTDQWEKCKGSPGSHGGISATGLSPRISAVAEEEDYFYFRNRRTGEISWSPWVQARDQGTGACFYVHVETGKHTYRRPAGALMPNLRRALSDEAKVMLGEAM